MWEYFLLDYMTSVFFSGAKHMTRRETVRLNTNLQLNAEKYWKQNEEMVVKVIQRQHFSDFADLDLFIGKKIQR